MRYAVQQRKLGVLLIGEYGTGKTYLSRSLRKFLPQEENLFIYVANPRIDPLDFLRAVAYDLQQDLALPDKPTKTDFLRCIKQALEDHHNKGVYVAIVVDEAQSIEDEALIEEIRLLLNIQSEEHSLFTLILLGQPYLQEMVEKVPQLKQRLSIRYKLACLGGQETKEYIEHRLRVAGATRKIFTDLAHSEIYAISKGMPRAINNICDLALLTGFLQKAGVIHKGIIATAGEDLSQL